VAALSKWRMSEDATAPSGLIGPNAILQLLPVLDRFGGPGRGRALLDHAGIANVPDGRAMIPETLAARLHHQLRLEEPAMAPSLAAEAGQRTADYILAHRIPKPAQWLLHHLPAALAAPLLSKAITQHAWTFAGSGQFTALTPWQFQITDNPLIQGEASPQCLCHWHAAVFARLYSVLVAPGCTCTETTCGACGPQTPCRFTLSKS
jgi:divinyl protochlorophyllide a 8-vinyl-reductase